MALDFEKGLLEMGEAADVHHDYLSFHRDRLCFLLQELEHSIEPGSKV